MNLFSFACDYVEEDNVRGLQGIIDLKKAPMAIIIGADRAGISSRVIRFLERATEELPLISAALRFLETRGISSEGAVVRGAGNAVMLCVPESPSCGLR